MKSDSFDHAMVKQRPQPTSSNTIGAMEMTTTSSSEAESFLPSSSTRIQLPTSPKQPRSNRSKLFVILIAAAALVTWTVLSSSEDSKEVDATEAFFSKTTFHPKSYNTTTNGTFDVEEDGIIEQGDDDEEEEEESVDSMDTDEQDGEKVSKKEQDDDDDDDDDDNEEPDDEEEVTHPEPDMTILPRKLYNIIGLESSGTHFVTGILQNALQLPKFREGSASSLTVESYDTQVVHYSLPWGSTCESHARNNFGKGVPTVDVVLPSQCVQGGSSSTVVKKECKALAKEAWGTSASMDSRGKVSYPERYNLDIISNKEFYEAHNVQVYNIIVIRDPTISFQARKGANHCKSSALAQKEEEAGTAIIIDAINKYILNKDTDRLVTAETYPMWHETNLIAARDNGRNLRSLLSGSGGLPSGNNVVLVSYESIMKLREVYVELLYQTLGIESDYQPDFKDGNVKYVQH